MSKGATDVQVVDAPSMRVGDFELNIEPVVEEASPINPLFPAPQYLINRDVWVLWKYETRNDKRTKVPYQINGKRASTTKASTWGNYYKVCAVFEGDKNEKSHRFDGIGVCFDGSFIGIDIDHCILDGCESDPAKDISSRLGTYTEYSPSLAGIHVLLVGDIELPKNKNTELGIEIYKKGRFFTFTGKKLPDSPQEMCENPEELRKLYAKYIYDDFEQAHLTSSPVEPPVVSQPAEMTVDAVMDRMEHSSKWDDIKSLLDGNLAAYSMDDSAADLALCNHLAYFTRRNAALIDKIFRTSKLFRPKWDEEHGSQTYGEMTIDRACRDTRSVDGDETRYRYTEGGNANRLADLHGKDLRYCGHMNSWLIWDGNRWKIDDTGVVYQMSRDVVSQLYAEARNKLTSMQQRGNENPKTIQLVAKFAQTTDTARGLFNIVKLSSTLPELSVSPLDLDNKPMMLNTVGTTIDFANPDAMLSDPNRSDLLTKVCGCAFDFDAKCPNWEKFIAEIFNNDSALIEFVQKAIGYSLTGKVSEKCFFFCWGEGSNGKTVFLNVIRAMFGDYGQQASIKTFLKKKGESEIRDDLVNLKGARFVSAVEPDESARFDMEVMKPLTGNDPIRCRTLHQRQIEYLPEVKLWIAGNTRPMITETNAGAWDRVRLIPFLVSFIGREDRKLEDRLKTELSGILNWAIKGYRMYIETGLQAPNCVKSATEEYKVECNSLLAFVTQNCVINTMAGLKIPKRDLYNAYCEYCNIEGQYPYSSRRVKATLATQGVQSIHTRDGDVYTNITLKERAPGQVQLPQARSALAVEAPTMSKIDMDTPLSSDKPALSEDKST